MKIFVSVKAGVKKEKIDAKGKNEFVVSVREPAKEGKANAAVQKALAEHFKMAPSRIRLVSGARSKKKAFVVL